MSRVSQELGPDSPRWDRGAAALPLLRTLFCFLIAATLSAQQAPPEATIGPGSTSVRIVPPRPNYLFPDGRSYVYSAEWHLITDRKSTRLNSSHLGISYAVFCLKK